MNQYSIDNVTALINGVRVEDFAEGDDVLVAQRINDAITHKVGADGQMTIAISPDKSGEIILKVMQSSPVNFQLYSFIQAAQAGNFTPIVFQMIDSQLQDIINGTVGFIPNLAPMTRGQGVNENEWRLVFEKLYIKGGAITVSGVGAIVGSVLGAQIG